jgi:hypothetical protein
LLEVKKLSPAGRELTLAAIRHPAGDELDEVKKPHPTGGQIVLSEKGYPTRSKLRCEFDPQLSWLHYRALMRVGEDSAAWAFFEQEPLKRLAMPPLLSPR